jgi:hypothetical protein
VKEIPLYRRSGGCNRFPETLTFIIVGYALVDDWWYEFLMKWRWGMQTGSSGVSYARRVEVHVVNGSKRTVTIFMHQVVAGFKNVDHRNCNGLDDREENLRSGVLNDANKRLQTRSTSGKKGVSWNRNSQCWVAGIRKAGQFFYLGSFAELAAAAEAYDIKAVELFGEYARVNGV